MVEEPISLSFAFRPRSILVQINLLHSLAQPYGTCTRVIYLTQTLLYVEHHTGKQLVPFLKSLVWLGLGWVRTLDLPNSKETLYHYTVESVKLSIKKSLKNLLRADGKESSCHHRWFKRFCWMFLVFR